MTVTARVDVTGLARFKLRVRIALGLIKLAAWIAPFNMNVTMEK